MKEIGSEYWNNETVYLSDKRKKDWMEQVVFLSGRTAVDAIAAELAEQKKTIVCLPDYCCESMIAPFIRRGMQVLFYKVGWKPGGLEYAVDFEQSFDVLFILQYFGYENEGVAAIIQKAKELGKIVIEDATHSIFQEKPFAAESDYVFASLRKWCALPGGAFFQKKGKEGAGKPEKTFSEFLRKRREAEKEKERHIQGSRGENIKHFRELFCEAERMLDRDYAGYGLDRESRESLFQIDFERLAEIRRKNAVLLTRQLQGLEGIQTVFPEVKEGDAPLFVPILAEERESLQSYLSSRKIYCPIHWPASHYVPWPGQLYQKELSLVCDQRYGEEEMERIWKTVKEWVLRK